MRKLVSTMVLLGLAIGLTGCGGSDDKPFVGTGTTTGTGGAAAVTVTSSASTVAAGGTATISAVVSDTNNSPVNGSTVTFSTSAGSVAPTTATTGATGTATTTLSAGSAATGTAIVVTATVGTLTGSTTVTVSSTSGSQSSLSIQTSLPQIPSDSSKAATITVLVRNASNNFVSGVPVSFAASSGGLTVTQGTTDSSGAAIAMLTPAGDPTNRNITVTATVGSSKATIVVPVVGTTLTLTGPSSLVSGSSGTYNVTLADAGKNPITATSVTVASAGNTVTPTTITTDASGSGTFQVTAVKTGSDTVTASALGQSASQDLTVSSQSFTFTAPAANALSPLNQALGVTVHWTSAGTPVAGQTVSFASTRGTLSAATAVTDASGNASVTVSSTSAGPAIIAASATGVTAQVPITFESTVPSAIAIQASPDTIATQEQSTITAIVRDAAGNLVNNQTVAFKLTDVTGGSLSFATVVTDTEGVAQTVYTASGTPSTSNGVVVAATVQGTAITASTTLTVGGQTVFISLGTGNQIGENSTKTQFQMPWVVQAVDSSGNPVNNVAITFTIHSSSRPNWAYAKGTYEVCGSSWVQYNTTPGCGANPPVTCLNEDINLTGVYEASEDFNNNGKLDPGDVAVATPGSVITATDGSATFLVEYPEDHALWVQATLTATATVQGTQSSTEATFVLPMLATYLTSTTTEPPGFVSPYGVANTCSNPH
jgi:Bacterial Ig-like domain (group 1)